MKNKNCVGAHRVVEFRERSESIKNKILKIAVFGVVVGGLAVLPATQTYAEEGADESTTRTIENESADEEAPAETVKFSFSESKDPVPVEAVEVPKLGDTSTQDTPVMTAPATSEDVYVEPLGETASWYPATQNYDAVINYEYGTMSDFTLNFANEKIGETTLEQALQVIITFGSLTAVALAGLLVIKVVQRRF